MKSVTRVCVIILISWALIVQATFEGWSKNRFNFIAESSGDFDNLEEFKKSNALDFFQLRITPVIVRSFNESLALYFESVKNGVMNEMLLLQFLKNKQEIIHFTIHNFTDSRRYKPRTFNPNSVSEFDPAKFNSLPGCEGYFARFNSTVYTGSLPLCSKFINGHLMAYKVHDTYSNSRHMSAD